MQSERERSHFIPIRPQSRPCLLSEYYNSHHMILVSASVKILFWTGLGQGDWDWEVTVAIIQMLRCTGRQMLQNNSLKVCIIRLCGDFVCVLCPQ